MVSPEKPSANEEWSRDWDAIYSKKYLVYKTGGESEPISVSNYATKYNWVKNFVQAEIMQEIYQRTTGTEDSNEDWIKNFSECFNKALEIKIQKYGSELIEMLYSDFDEVVDKIKQMMHALYYAEHKVKEDLNLDGESRGKVLGAIESEIVKHPDAMVEEGNIVGLIPEIEEALKVA